MRHVQATTSRRRFAVLHASRRVQAATMTLGPGDASDDEPSNEHPDSEQWLLVIKGRGEAVVRRRRGKPRTQLLRAGSLLLIEPGELHQIRNTGRNPLVTINFYAPPAYDSDAHPR
jgi:mannose-6-phosphate isomerase-like protein (cupin superfamily)